MIKENDMFNPDVMKETKFPKGLSANFEFDNYILSVVKNEISYGNDKGLYEISVFDAGNQIELPGITDKGDTVRGWLTKDDVSSIMKKLTSITGTNAKLL